MQKVVNAGWHSSHKPKSKNEAEQNDGPYNIKKQPVGAYGFLKNRWLNMNPDEFSVSQKTIKVLTVLLCTELAMVISKTINSSNPTKS